MCYVTGTRKSVWKQSLIPASCICAESERQRRMDNPEHVICSGSGAQQEQEPSTLEIGDFGDSVQKNSVFVNLLIKLALHEVFVP